MSERSPCRAACLVRPGRWACALSPHTLLFCFSFRFFVAGVRAGLEPPPPFKKIAKAAQKQINNFTFPSIFTSIRIVDPLSLDNLMSSCPLLALNADCLGVILRCCDLRSLLALRCTTRDSWKSRISECILDLYFYESPSPSTETDAALLSALHGFLADPSGPGGRVQALVVAADSVDVSHPYTLAAQSFLTRCDAFFQHSLRGLKVLDLSTGAATFAVHTGVYEAIRGAARAGHLQYLMECAVDVNEACPHDLRTVLCNGCPLLRRLELREYFDSPLVRDDPKLHNILLEHFIAAADVWPSLKVLDIGWMFERIFDEIDAESIPDMGRRIAERINSVKFPELTTLKIKVIDGDVFLNIFRAIISTRSQFLGNQITAVHIEHGCGRTHDSFVMQQQWSDYAAELAEGRGTGFCGRKMPILFPSLNTIRTQNFFPSSYFFEFIPSTSAIALQLSPHPDDPAIAHFLRNCYRPGVASPTISELCIQSEPVYSTAESDAFLVNRNAAALYWGNCTRYDELGDYDGGILDAMSDGNFQDLKYLKIGCLVGLWKDDMADGEEETFRLFRCSSLEHVVLVMGAVGESVSMRRCDECIESMVDLLVILQKGVEMQHLRYLDIIIHDSELWEYAVRSIVSLARGGLGCAGDDARGEVVFYDGPPVMGVNSSPDSIYSPRRQPNLTVRVLGYRLRIVLRIY